MSFDLKLALGTIAPTLATMLGGPFAGTAVTALLAATGISSTGNQVKDLAAVTAVVQDGKISPDVMAAIRKADQEHEAIMAQNNYDLQKLNADHESAMAAIAVQEDQLVIKDVEGARKANGEKEQMWTLAWLILGTFAILMCFILYGCYLLLTTSIAINTSTAVAIAGLVSGISGYVAANAQTVINFIYGGSLGSRNNGKALAASVQQSIQQLGTSAGIKKEV